MKKGKGGGFLAHIKSHRKEGKKGSRRARK
jgi:hypothetical protein